MKLLCILLVSLISMLGFGGCSSKIALDISDADKITLKSEKYGIFVNITEDEYVDRITENINNLKLKEEGTRTFSDSDILYTLTWYTSDNNVIKDVSIITDNQLSDKNTVYMNTERNNKIDISFLEEQLGIFTMKAKILTIDDYCFFVEPVTGSPELSSATLFRIPRELNGSIIEAQVGDVLLIVYDGEILESLSESAQFNKIYDVQIIDDVQK